ncbi:hypothetical protein D0862_02468 [Hortaea werneckii]|uniref:Plasma membrane stress response protein n=1 Tax=Hortaea werneckii TaxID=91943 RepID=A0A3M7HIE8_HORWE|nr:hypothetical protein D0862_02468 [Hortaea werneckii]
MPGLSLNDLSSLPIETEEPEFEVDWVLVYDFSEIESSEAIEEFTTLIKDLETVGLQCQVRHGYGLSVLVLLRVPRNLLGNEVYRSRVKDWLFSIVHTRPIGDKSTVVKAKSSAEALRTVYHLVTWTHEQGGAGVTANFGQWTRIRSSFPPHEAGATRKLLGRLARKMVVDMDDLDRINDLFGEKVAFYYAFIQCYSLFLIVPAAAGILCWIFGEPYSFSFAVFLLAWGIFFTEYWKRQEIDLSVRWNVRGVAALKVNRPQYTWERQDVDPITGQVRRVFPIYKRLARQALFFPFAILAGLALGAALAATFFLEAFISDVYDGSTEDHHWALSYLPTIILSCCLPFILSSLTSIASRMSEYENYRTNDDYDLAQTRKTFVLNFVVSFLPIFITAYIYVPYGNRLLLYFTPSSWTAAIKVLQNLQIDPERLQQEVISLSMTGQVMSFGEEVVVPYLRGRASARWREYKRESQVSRSIHMRKDSDQTERTFLRDSPHESAMLSRIRWEAEADVYDVHEDIMEMCVQFGYLVLFGVAWPLMPLGFLVNNWIELRGDLFKLCEGSQRPAPIRADSIGHSIAALELLTWLGSLSTAALAYLYHGERPMSQIRLSYLLLIVFISEQAFLGFKLLVSYSLSIVGSQVVREAESKRFLMRKTYLETFSEEAASTSQEELAREHATSRRSEGVSLTEKGAGSQKDSRATTGTQTKNLRDGPDVQPMKEGSREEDDYQTETAQRFWESRKEDQMSTVEAGARLIVALKELHQHRINHMPSIDVDKSK